MFPKPPATVRGSQPLTRSQILKRAATIDDQNPLEVLGLGPDPSVESIARAFRAQCRRWHPQLLPSQHSDLEPAVQKVYSRILSARAVLSDPQRQLRRQPQPPPLPKANGRHSSTDSPPHSDGASVPPQSRPADRFRAPQIDTAAAIKVLDRAKQLLQADRIRQAKAQVRTAQQLDPNLPDASALDAWIRALELGPPIGKVSAETYYRGPIRLLQAIVKQHPGNETARYYLAVLLRQSGLVDEAIANFKHLLRSNPQHLDATRELRLIEMRRRQRQRSPLSRLFRRAVA